MAVRAPIWANLLVSQKGIPFVRHRVRECDQILHFDALDQILHFDALVGE